MLLSVRILGWEIVAVEIGTPAEVEEALTDGGYVTSMPVGFVANHELPEGSGLPFREGWE